MLKKIMIILILSVALTGCTLQSEDSLFKQQTSQTEEREEKGEEEKNQEENSDSEQQNIAYTLGEPKLQYGLELPSESTRPSQSALTVAYYSNHEDYFNHAFPYREYDEAYFAKKDLLIVEAFTHIYGVKFETLELILENNVLTVHVLEKAPSIYLCVYLPRLNCFYLEFDKLDGVNSATAAHRVRYDYESFNLPEDQALIEDRLANPNYLDVTVSMTFTYQQMSSSERENYVNQKINQWVNPVLDNNLHLIDRSNYGFSISIRLYRLEIDELNELMLCLADEDLEFLTVGFRNF